MLGDRYELQQVLLNLVTNAVQAVSELARRTAAADQARHRAPRTARRCSGCATPAPACRRTSSPTCSRPFFTTKAPGEGTGLGLSLSYGLVKAHGGVLTYEPPPEGGAEFRVTLPLLRRAGADVDREAPTSHAGRGLVAPRFSWWTTTRRSTGW